MTNDSPSRPASSGRDGGRRGPLRRQQSDTATKALSPTELKRLHRRWRRDSDLRLALILDGVQKPYNVGSLLRSAAAYNVETVWTVPPAPPADHPAVAKTALGSGRFMEHRAAETGRDALYQASSEGFLTVAIELTAEATPLHEVETGRAVCLILGHEDRGVHRDTLQHADVIAYLPQLGRIGSLNVAQAGTVALYEAARHSWTSP